MCRVTLFCDAWCTPHRTRSLYSSVFHVGLFRVEEGVLLTYEPVVVLGIVAHPFPEFASPIKSLRFCKGAPHFPPLLKSF